MRLTIILHPSAANEVEEACRYYDEVAGLGDDFVSELSRVLTRASKLPLSGRPWTARDPDRRVCLLNRFPYLVIARVQPAELRILAVAHQRRKPGYWRGR